jgi:hypothetical protein
LKSNCLNLGARELANVLRDLEALAKAESLNGAAELIRAAHGEFDLVKPLVQALKDKAAIAPAAELI